MKENDVIAGNYRILQEIGRGGTGTVFLGYHQHLRKYVVLKETRLSIGDERVIRRETDILKNLHHMYLPQVYDFLIDGSNVITVLDYVEGSDLSRYPCGPENLSEEVLLKWLEQMAEVLAYLHSNQVPVIHSDIKPGNVIIRPNGDICLIDFNIQIDHCFIADIDMFVTYFNGLLAYQIFLIVFQLQEELQLHGVHILELAEEVASIALLIVCDEVL